MPWIQGFRIVDGGALAKNAIALSYDSHFLCAELDGRITLSRPRIGLWELFSTKTLSDEASTEMLAGDETPASDPPD